MNIIKKVLSSLIIAGVIILLTGLYYLVVKAGIPYQDPTPELQIRYAVSMGIGDELTKIGACMTAAAAVLRIIAGVIAGKNSKGTSWEKN